MTALLAALLALTLQNDPGPTAPVQTAEITSGLARREYRFREVEQGFAAPNRRHDLRARVDARGLRVVPRTRSGPWELRIETRGIARGDEALPARASSGPRRASERIVLEHGTLQEWFENDERGIEQGWTIAARPPGPADEPVRIRLAIEGDLSLRIHDGGRGGAFVDGTGVPRARYEGLAAWDASGRALATWLAPIPDGIAVVVEDEGAIYPLTVDPVVTGPTWSVEGTGPAPGSGLLGGFLGDVNGDGFDDVFVSEPQLPTSSVGRLRIHFGASSGPSPDPDWVLPTTTATNVSMLSLGDLNGDGYGDVGVIPGPVNIHLGSPGGPSLVYDQQVDDEIFVQHAAHRIGDVNGDGYDDLLTRVRNDPFPSIFRVHEGEPGGVDPSAVWTLVTTETATWRGGEGGPGDANGDGYADLLIHAVAYDGGHDNEGKAWLYLGGPSGPAASAIWTVETNQTDARLEATWAGDVNRDGRSDLLITSYDFDNGQTDEGKIWLYLGGASGPSTTAAWSVEGNQVDASLIVPTRQPGDVNADGYDDVLIRSASYDGGQTDEGMMWLYLGSASGLGSSAAWTFETNVAGAGISTSYLGAGDVDGDGHRDLLQNDRAYDGAGGTNCGRAQLYPGSPEGPPATHTWAADGTQAGAEMGASVATMLDLNADGYSDLVIGAPNYDAGSANGGGVFLYYGSASGLTLLGQYFSGQADSRYGASVSAAGDVNGDGFGDLIVGAPGWDNGETDEGRMFLYLGAAGALPGSSNARWESDQAGAGMGASVARAGDVNGDGLSDVIVGTSGWDNGETDEGRIQVFHGHATSLLTLAYAWESDQAGAAFGACVAGAGDVNRDRYDDVVAAAPLHDDGESDEGLVMAFHGSKSGLLSGPQWFEWGDQADAHFGAAVASAGDVNGDGFSDVVVGAPLEESDVPLADEGCVRVFHGSASGLAASAAWTLLGGQAGAELGSAACAAGDLDGDGIGDLLTGAPGYDGIFEDGGRVRAYLGSASGLATSPLWSEAGDDFALRLGGVLASAGDVDGNGYADFVLGVPEYAALGTDQGRVVLFPGKERGGPLRGIQQQRFDGTAAIGLHGVSEDPSAFRVWGKYDRPQVLGENAWLEWEVVPVGMPFLGASQQEGSHVSYAAGTLLLVEDGTFVSPFKTDVRWRARFATDDPLRRHSVWFTQPGNAPSEAKLRLRGTGKKYELAPSGPLPGVSGSL